MELTDEKVMIGASTVCKHLSIHFNELADICEKSGSSPDRVAAYRHASKDAELAVCGGFGWQLDLRDSLRKAGRDA